MCRDSPVEGLLPVWEMMRRQSAAALPSSLNCAIRALDHELFRVWQHLLKMLAC